MTKQMAKKSRTIEIVKEASIKEPTNKVELDVKYVEIVYVGISDEASRVGIVTGAHYDFYKDRYKMPTPTLVSEQDVSALLLETGKGCIPCRHGQDPSRIFMTKAEWDLDIARAKVQNSI